MLSPFEQPYLSSVPESVYPRRGSALVEKATAETSHGNVAGNLGGNRFEVFGGTLALNQVECPEHASLVLLVPQHLKITLAG